MKKNLIRLTCFLLSAGMLMGCALSESTVPSTSSSAPISGSEPISGSSSETSSSTSHYSSSSEDTSSSVEPVSSSSSEEPIHVHDMEKHAGSAPTCTEPGLKDYWHCKTCNENFEDQAGTIRIADLEAWKNGEGKLAPLGHKMEASEYSLVNGVGKVKEICTNTGCSHENVIDITTLHNVDGLTELLKELPEGEITSDYYMVKGGLSSDQKSLLGDKSSIKLYNLANNTGADLVPGNDITVIAKMQNYYGDLENKDGAAVAAETHKSDVAVECDSHATTDLVAGKYDYLETVTFSVTVEPGYYIKSVTFNGGTLLKDANYKYSFNVAYGKNEIKIETTDNKPVVTSYTKLASYTPKNGDIIIFTAETNDKKYVMSDFSNEYSKGVATEYTTDVPENPLEVLVVTNDDGWSLKIGDKFLYVSAKNSMKLQGLPFKWTYNSAEGTFYGDNGGTNYGIKFNSSATLFRPYASGQVSLIYWIKNAECEHKNTDEHAEVPATCTKDGIKQYWTCKDCGAYLLKDESGNFVEVSYFNDIVVPAGHKFEEKWTFDGTHHWHKCSICGEAEEKIAHELGELVPEVPAKCKTDGVKAHYECSECHALFDDAEHLTDADSLIIPQLGHDVTEVAAKEATCVEKGMEHHFECSHEPNVYYGAYDASEDELSKPFTHDPELPVNPDNHVHGFTYEHNGEFSKDGSEHTKTCKDECGYSIDEACTWGVGEVTKEPTKDEEGEMTFYCTHECGGYYTVTLPKLTHHHDEAGAIYFDSSEGWKQKWICYGGTDCYADPSHSGEHVEFSDLYTGTIEATITKADGVMYGYETLQDAFDDVSDNEVIELFNDIKLTGEVKFSRENVLANLDLCGYSIETASSYQEEGDSNMIVVDDGILAITDSEDGGCISAAKDSDNIPLVTTGKGTLDILGGEFGGNKAGGAVFVSSSESHVNVHGGYFYFVDPETVLADETNFALAEGVSSTNVLIYSGRFSADPTRVIGKEDETFIALNENVAMSIQTISKDEKQYVVDKFTELVEQRFESITLVDNIVADNFITLDKEYNLFLDLNGYNYTATCKTSFLITGDSSLTINGCLEGGEKNGTVTGTIIVGYNGGTDSDGNPAINGSLTIEGGTYISSVSGEAAIQSNGGCDKADITINDATIKSIDDIAIYVAGNGIINIIDSRIEGGTGIYAKSGTIILTDCEIIATGNHVDPVKNNNGAPSTGDGIILDSNSNYKGNIELSFSGKSSITSEHGYALREFITVGEASLVNGIAISSTVELKSYLADLYLTSAFIEKVGNKEAVLAYPTSIIACADVIDGGALYYQYYSDLDKAVASDFLVLHIVNDVTTDKTVVIDKDFAIEICEDVSYVYTGKTGYAFQVKPGHEVIFTGKGVISSASRGIEIVGSNTHVDVDIVSLDRALGIYDNCIVNIGECNLLSGSKDFTVFFYERQVGTLTVNLDGTHVNNSEGPAIGGNGTYGDDHICNLTISDGNITTGALNSSKEYEGGEVGIYFPCAGSLVIKENTRVIGLTALYVKAGDITLENSLFIAYGPKVPYTFYNNGCVETGDAVVFDNCGYPSGVTMVINPITGCMFESANAKEIGTYAWGNRCECSVTVVVPITETTSTFTSKSWATADNSWTKVKDGYGYNADVPDSGTIGKGVQITAATTGAGAISNKEFDNVTKVIFSYATNASKGKGTINVYVNDVLFGTFTISTYSDTLTTAEITGLPSSGKVKFIIDCSENSLYIKSVTIVEGGDFVTKGDRTTLVETINAYKLFAKQYDDDVNMTLPTCPIDGYTYSWSVNDPGVITGNVLTIAQGSEDKDYTVKVTLRSTADGEFEYTRTFESFKVTRYINYGSKDAPLSTDEAKAIIDEQCSSSGKYTKKQLVVRGVITDDPDTSTAGRAQKYHITTDGSSYSLYVFTSNYAESSKVIKGATVTVSGYVTNYYNSDDKTSTIEMAKGPSTDAVYPSILDLFVPVSSVEIDQKPAEGSLKIAKGSSTDLTYSVLPEFATNKNATWSIVGETSDIISIDVDSGVCTVTGLKGGDAQVKVTTEDGSKVDTIAITVTDIVPVETITVTPSTATIEVGETVDFTATVLPSNSIQEVNWELASGSEEFASISELDGVCTLTGIKAGTATLYAKATDESGVKGTATITINKAVSKFTKVMSTADLTDGDYLIVYENSATSAYVFNGVDVANDYVEAEIANGVIAYTNELRKLTVSIEAMDGGHSIKVNKGSNGGKYMSGTSGSNVINFGTNKSANAISITEGDATIISNTSTIIFNTTAGQNRFRYYKAGTTGNVYHEVSLYKLDLHPVALEGLSFEEGTESTLGTGSTMNLTPVYSPDDATEIDLEWTSNDSDVAKVDKKTGLITGVAAGTAVITATSVDNDKVSASCTITVDNIHVTSVAVTPSTAEIAVGETTTLTATVSPSEATIKTVTWSSDDEGVATVAADGTVTGVAAGTATITATTTDGGKTASATVTVKQASYLALDFSTQGAYGLPTSKAVDTKNGTFSVASSTANDWGYSRVVSNKGYAMFQTQKDAKNYGSGDANAPAFIYNKIAFDKPISKVELIINSGASADAVYAVSVGTSEISAFNSETTYKAKSPDKTPLTFTITEKDVKFVNIGVTTAKNGQLVGVKIYFAD